MRRIGAVAASLAMASGVALAAAFVPGSTAATTGDLLWKSTFERGTAGMQAWYDVNGVGRTSATHRGGKWSLDVDANDFWGVEEAWPGTHAVTPGAAYTFTGFVKTSPGDGQDVKVSAFFVDSSSSQVGDAVTVATVPASSDAWAKYEGTVTAPAGAATVGFRYTGDTAAHVYLDDVRTYSADVAPEPSPSPSPTPDPTPTEEPSPTPTPTEEPSPSPTPTDTPTPGANEQVCTDPQYVWTDWSSTGLGDYYADADWWAAGGYNYHQEMGVCSYHSWYAKANVANHSDGAVLAYPNVHRDYHDWGTGFEPRIDSFSSITSDFAHISPSPKVGTYDVAYDLWINGVADSGSTELMIWTDNHNQTPAGDVVDTGVTLSGYTWDVWATGDNSYIAFVTSDGSEVRSGTMDLKAFMTYLMGTGRLPASSTLGQVDYGVEVVQTGAQWVRWDFTNFNVNAVPK